MEIHSYCCFIMFVNCSLLFPFLLSKPVSLNAIIAAEQQSEPLQTAQITLSESRSQRKALPKLSTTFTGKVADFHPETFERISPLQYRKTFQIRTPLRPKRIKYTHKPRRSSRVNTATKREIDNDDLYNKNYIPLLRSLSVLFNNILDTESGNDDVRVKHHNRKQSFSRNDDCRCAHTSKYEVTDRDSTKTTASITTFITPKIPTKNDIITLSETSSTSPYNTINHNFSPLRRHKNVPILPPRNTIGSRRNHNGFNEGSVSTYNRNFEGDIPGNNGSNEDNNSGRETTESNTENHKQYTNSDPRDDANCVGACGAIGRNTTSTTQDETRTTEAIIEPVKTFTNDRGDGNKFEGFDQFETRRNETESRTFLPQSSSRLRGSESQEEATEILWQIQSPKEGIVDVTLNFTRNQRLTDRDGAMAQENKEDRRANKKLIIDDLSTTLLNASRFDFATDKPTDKHKIVVIYDGYSIARDVNGENKLTEKAYRILL